MTECDLFCFRIMSQMHKNNIYNVNRPSHKTQFQTAHISARQFKVLGTQKSCINVNALDRHWSTIKANVIKGHWQTLKKHLEKYALFNVLIMKKKCIEQLMLKWQVFIVRQHDRRNSLMSQAESGSVLSLCW